MESMVSALKQTRSILQKGGQLKAAGMLERETYLLHPFRQKARLLSEMKS
jgi:hypothetical protein